MRSDGLVPNVKSYAGCIDACAKAIQWKKACYLLDEMRAAGVQVGFDVYCASLSPISRQSHTTFHRPLHV